MQVQCPAGCSHGTFFRVQMMMAEGPGGKQITKEVISEESCSRCGGTGMIEGQGRS